MKEKQFKKILKKGVNQIDLPVTEQQLQNFWVYYNFLKQENNKYNLTGIITPREVIYKHFLDSLVFAQHFSLNNYKKVLDIGSGAGFPGIVLKIMFPHLNFILIDSRLKRINFLKRLSHKLAIGEVKIKCIHGRAEVLAHQKEYREEFSLVVARAVAPLNVLAEYALGFVRPGGRFVAYKGINYQQELNKARKAIDILGGKISQIISLKVPGITEKRFLLVIEKIIAISRHYPRKTGKPKKAPL